jgi:hypothetical protein
MKLTKVAAATVMAGGLVFGGVGLGSGVAIAQPRAPMPLDPGRGPGGHGHDDCPPRCGGPDFKRGPDFNRGPDFDRGDWKRNQWRPDPHQRWDNRWGAPPWGWGPPPPVYWNGGYRPQQIDYWGYQATPVWDDGFRQWGIWLFGVWIPVFGAGFN